MFLDRDGVINYSLIYKNKPYAPRKIEDVNIIPFVSEALSQIKDMNFLTIVITNQPDIENDLISISESLRINNWIKDKLMIDQIYVCPHNNKNNCNCRKPKPGLIYKASQDFNIDISKSYLVGDRWKDIKCGQLAGCSKNFFIDYGYDEQKPEGNFEYATSLINATENIYRLQNNY